MIHSVITFVIIFAVAFLGCILADVVYDRWLAKPIDALLDRFTKPATDPAPVTLRSVPPAAERYANVTDPNWRARVRKTETFDGNNGGAAA